MKRYIFCILTLALLTGTSVLAAPKREKKNSISMSTAKKLLKETDGKQKQEDPKKPVQHYYKNMKYRKIGEAKWKLTYFHVYSAYVKERDADIEEYRALVFNNKEEYLGYYAADEDVEDVDDEGIRFNYSSSAGNIIEFDQKTGLPKEAELNGDTVVFVPFVKIEEEKAGEASTNKTAKATSK